jgi:ribulose-5-phosphate 4-epimerase/fuculose-1-phosphate aldolase
MNVLDAAIQDLVMANHILANENIVDAYGHVSVRHPENPQRFLLSCSRSPEFVAADDILEFGFDGEPVVPGGKKPYLERFIHASVYAARPDVNAVIHSHAADVLPFTISTRPLQPVLNTASGIGEHVPVWDIRDRFGDTNILVESIAQADDLASTLAGNSVTLMRGHGFTAVGRTLIEVVKSAIYLPLNARVMMAALSLGGEIKPLSPGEIAIRHKTPIDSPAYTRAWEYWTNRVKLSRVGACSCCGGEHGQNDTDNARGK